MKRYAHNISWRVVWACRISKDTLDAVAGVSVGTVLGDTLLHQVPLLSAAVLLIPAVALAIRAGLSSFLRLAEAGTSVRYNFSYPSSSPFAQSNSLNTSTNGGSSLIGTGEYLVNFKARVTTSTTAGTVAVRFNRVSGAGTITFAGGSILRYRAY